MKNLKKIFAIALSVATVAMSTSAFAATYDAEATSVALTAEEIATLDSYAGQMTVVVVPKTFGESSTAADIYYINQDDAAAFAAIIADMGVKAELDDTKEWQVRIGGENVAEVVTFDVTFTEEGPVFELGNVDGNYDDEGNAIINGSDAVYVLKQFAGTVGDTCPHPAGWEAFIAAANVDGNYDDANEPIVNGSDAVYILKAFAGTLEDGFPAAK